MNIDEELNKIIFKYHLDKYYPHYKNMYEAKKILQSLIGEVEKNGRKVIFVGDNRHGIEFIENISKNYIDIHFSLIPQMI